MTQKENITSVRNRTLSGVSGGGSFFLGAADTAFAGTCPPATRGSTPGCDAARAGACVDVDMLAMVVVASIPKIPRGTFLRGLCREASTVQLEAGVASSVGHFPTVAVPAPTPAPAPAPSTKRMDTKSE